MSRTPHHKPADTVDQRLGYIPERAEKGGTDDLCVRYLLFCQRQTSVPEGRD